MPCPGGRQPRAPTTAVGRAVAYVRDGVRSIAPVIDNGQSYDPQNYFTGAFSIGGTNSQLVTVPKNSVLHKSLAISPSAAGRAIVRAMERTLKNYLVVYLDGYHLGLGNFFIKTIPSR